MLVDNYFYLLAVWKAEEVAWHNEKFEHNS